jgi:hypothetical protein
VTKPPTTELPFWLNGLALTLTLDDAGLVFTSTTSGAEALQFSYFDVNSWHAGEEDGVKTGADRPRPVSTTAQRGSTTNSSWAALGFPPLVLSVHPSPMVGGRGAAETAAASGDAIRTDDESGAIELTFDAHAEETAATACEAIDGAVWRISPSRLSRLSLYIAHSRTPHTHTLSLYVSPSSSSSFSSSTPLSSIHNHTAHIMWLVHHDDNEADAGFAVATRRPSRVAPLIPRAASGLESLGHVVGDVAHDAVRAEGHGRRRTSCVSLKKAGELCVCIVIDDVVFCVCFNSLLITFTCIYSAVNLGGECVP